MPPSFVHATPIRSLHCGEMGIVQYPRYFELLGEVIEAFFAAALHWPVAEMQRRDGLGLAMGRLCTEFRSPSRLGERLDWTLAVRSLGRASLDVAVAASAGGKGRLALEATLVLVDLAALSARPWPDPVRAALTERLDSGSGPGPQKT